MKTIGTILFVISLFISFLSVLFFPMLLTDDEKLNTKIFKVWFYVLIFDLAPMITSGIIMHFA